MALCAGAGFAQVAPSSDAASQANDVSCQAKNYSTPDAQEAVVSWPKQMPVQSLDKACWVSAEQVVDAVHGTSKPNLVDVRSRSLQKADPLANALQVELADVANKRFLQNESVVLMGTGLDYVSIGQVCQQLTQQGFTNVRAVHGGVDVWRTALAAKQSGSQSTSVAVFGQRLQSIDASDWITSLGQGVQWTVVSVSAALQQAPDEHLPVPRQQLVSIRVDGKERDEKWVDAVVRAVQDALKKQMNTNSAQALVVVPDAAMNDSLRQKVEQYLAKATPRSSQTQALPVYWLLGGWQGYELLVAQIAAIQQTANHRLQIPCGRI